MGNGWDWNGVERIGEVLQVLWGMERSVTDRNGACGNAGFVRSVKERMRTAGVEGTGTERRSFAGMVLQETVWFGAEGWGSAGEAGKDRKELVWTGRADIINLFLV